MMNEAQREMPRYLCHKEVHALKIETINQAPAERARIGGSWLLMPVEDGYGPIEVSHDWYMKHTPNAGGYLVVYEDGYQSYSPSEAFEGGYTLIPTDFRDRVRQEKAALDVLANKLGAFIITPAYMALPHAERVRQAAQLKTMRAYSAILTERIAAF